ncbi:major facilitator superfamily domain-containing protein [Xylogone sp. PMI_703]|nr:major facilitator superfamily domain-containing protein [Xylogone sp. PMI_703]
MESTRSSSPDYSESAGDNWDDLPFQMSELVPMNEEEGLFDSAGPAPQLERTEKLILIIAVLLEFLQTFDKTVIGYAKLHGLDYALGIDYFSWELVIWVGLLWLKPRWVQYIIPVCAGISGFTSIQSIVTNYVELSIFRGFIGFAEAGFQTVPLLLACRFEDQRLTRAVGMVFIARPLVTTISAPLASLLILIGQYMPIDSWRFVLLVEGFLGMLGAVFVGTLLINRDARELNTQGTQRPDLDIASCAENTRPSSEKRAEIFKDPTIYLLPIALFLLYLTFVPMPVLIGGQNPRGLAMPVYLTDTVFYMYPSILIFHILVALPYLAAALVAAYSTLYRSPRQLKDHASSICSLAIVSAGGYAILALLGQLSSNPAIRYSAIFPATMGFYGLGTHIVSWALRYHSRSNSRRAIAFTLLQIVGQWGPAFAVRLFYEWERPFYVRGTWSSASIMVGIASIALFLRFRMEKSPKNLREKPAETSRIPGIHR